MLVLFTDFGVNGPYIGQLSAAIHAVNSHACVINLFANAPAFNARASGFLLAAYARDFPVGTVFVCVVDPGVGTQLRKPVVMHIDGKVFVGPDNDLFDALVAHAQQASKQEILWQPQSLSATFHGRDLFAPVAARLENNTCPAEWLARPVICDRDNLAADLYAIIYIDDYGNAITGVRAVVVQAATALVVNSIRLKCYRTFAEAAHGEAFWYENANGLVEIAVNQGNAAAQLSLAPGTVIEFQ